MYQQYINSISKQLNQLPILPTMSNKEAVVFDLDECCLSSYHLHSSGILSRQSSFEQIIKVYSEYECSVIEPALQLYKKLIVQGYKIFIITGRPDLELLVKKTKLNLIKHSYPSPTQFYFMPKTCSYSNVGFFKKAIRDTLSAQGMRIKYNIGDQKTDFLGSKAQFNVHLPNPLY